MSEEYAASVALAAMGCTQFMMGHSNASKWGMVKEALAMRGAVSDIPSGAGHDLIRAAREKLSEGSSSGPDIDATDKDLMISEGRSHVEAVVPVLRALPDDAAAHVRAWLLGVAEHVAKASKDKGGSEKVSPAETAALEELGILLAG